MSEPVSIVITCYNLEKYIAAAVQSVKEQNYDGGLQIIVVDDHSTDASAKLLAAMQGIEVIRQPVNGGVMQAMIAGLEAARHDAIFFLDGDDVWARDKLALCMGILDREARFITHDLWYMDADGRPTTEKSRVAQKLLATDPSEQENLVFNCLVNHLDYVWLGSAFGIRRSLCDIRGFVAFCRSKSYLESCYQDWPLAVWIAFQKQGKLSYVDKKLFGYRLHGNNYSGAATSLEKLRRNYKKSRDTMRLVEEIMIAKGADPTHLRATQKIRMRYALLLASAEEPRKEIITSLFRNRGAIGLDRSGLKALARITLSLVFGADFAHKALTGRRLGTVFQCLGRNSEK